MVTGISKHRSVSVFCFSTINSGLWNRGPKLNQKPSILPVLGVHEYMQLLLCYSIVKVYVVNDSMGNALDLVVLAAADSIASEMELLKLNHNSL